MPRCLLSRQRPPRALDGVSDPRVWRTGEHLLAAHTLPEDVGKIAAKAGVKTLVLSHFVPGDDSSITDEQWAEGVHKHFQGRVIVGKDLMEI